jgi:hypothetical protein
MRQLPAASFPDRAGQRMPEIVGWNREENAPFEDALAELGAMLGLPVELVIKIGRPIPRNEVRARGILERDQGASGGERRLSPLGILAFRRTTSEDGDSDLPRPAGRARGWR